MANGVPDPDGEEAMRRQITEDLEQLQREFVALKQRFCDEGFTNVELVYQLTNVELVYQSDGYEFKASRGTNQGCQTSEQVKEVVERLVRELHREVDRGLIVALVVGDQLGAAFRLRPVPRI